MATPAAVIVPAHVSVCRGGFAMSKYDAILRYKTSMSIFKKWLADGVITKADLLTIDAILAEKYGFSPCSIFLEKTCYFSRSE
jgi:hypothetical protein